jgi:DNA-directed RNA polymerase subunit RPC12/RpoP
MIKRLLISILAAGLLGLAGRYVYMELEQESICSICHRAIHEGTSFLIHLQDGHTEEVCCPRCGLRFMKGRDDITDVEAADFYSGERLPARQAFYVEGSSVHPCCKDIAEKDRSGVRYDLVWDRCLPSLIAFKSWDEADAFRNQYGGVVKVYDELLQEEI